MNGFFYAILSIYLSIIIIINNNLAEFHVSHICMWVRRNIQFAKIARIYYSIELFTKKYIIIHSNKQLKQWQQQHQQQQ